MIYDVVYEEFWEPGEIRLPADGRKHWRGELPDELVERFHKAMAEMQAVWDELSYLTRERD